jgi:hypothetical protein
MNSHPEMVHPSHHEYQSAAPRELLTKRVNFGAPMTPSIRHHSGPSWFLVPFLKMKSPLPSIVALALAFGPMPAAKAQEKKEPAPESGTEAPAKDPNLVFQADFEGLTPGPIPADYFVVDGDWTVAEIDGGKALRLAETPLVDAQVQVGTSLKDEGGRISARVKADKKRRSFPRFGVGMHGMSGYRLRLFPVQNKIELVRNEEVVQSAALEWKPGEWWHLELSVSRAGEGWAVTGRAWPEGAERPEKAQVEHTGDEPKFSGKASISGTAFAGLPIHFDDIEVVRIPNPAPAAPQ